VLDELRAGIAARSLHLLTYAEAIFRALHVPHPARASVKSPAGFACACVTTQGALCFSI
jgi:hypothetical protein